MHFADKLNCFVGLNGQGKTNILDAIYLLSFTKSAYNAIDSLNITHGEEMAMVQGVYREETLSNSETPSNSPLKGENQKSPLKGDFGYSPFKGETEGVLDFRGSYYTNISTSVLLIVLPPRMSKRSTTLRSSRMFPVHERACSAAMASAAKVLRAMPISPHISSSK